MTAPIPQPDAVTAPVESLPNFRRCGQSPVLPEAGTGIVIQTDGLKRSGESSVWPLRGAFRVPRPQGIDQPGYILRRVALVLTPRSSHTAQGRWLVGDEMVFAEDASGTDRVTGFFNVDLLLHGFEFFARRDVYDLVVSLGSETSNLVTCEVEMSWVESGAPTPPGALGEEDAEEEEDSDDAGLEEDDDADDDDWEVDDPFED